MNTKNSGESVILLLRVIKLLKRLRIPYAVIGGFAASFYGPVRASLDVDALISVGQDKEKMERLIMMLSRENFKVEFRKGDFDDPIRSVLNIRDKFQNRIDLLTGIRGMGDDVFKRVVKVSFMRTRIAVVGIEDFIAMKIFAGSPKDIQDGIGAIKVSGKEINRGLLKKLTRRFGESAAARLEKILKDNIS